MRALVPHGTDTEGQNECYGTYDNANKTGYGPAYQYNCIHSSNPDESSIVDTVWYNYTLASAGTIIDENTTSSDLATNINTATESICPKGWTLPTTKQLDANRAISDFSPVIGGGYTNGNLYSENKYGIWWSSTAYSGAVRYVLFYNGDESSMNTSNGIGRRDGRYIRCVSEEKAITSLTYMQDMTSDS